MKMLKLIIILVFLLNISFSQLRVISVDDGNLIELSTGQKYRLAGLNIISKTNSNRQIAALHDSLKIFLKNYCWKSASHNKQIIELGADAVDLFCDSLNINEILLRKGYAIFYSQTNSEYKNLYKLSEEYAKISRNGIWKYVDNKIFMPAPENKQRILDSLEDLIKPLRIRKFSNDIIVKLIDNNLFLTSNGNYLKLKNVDVPSIYHKNEGVRKYAVSIFNKMQAYYLEKGIEVVFDKPIIPGSKIEYAGIRTKVSFTTINPLRSILQNGYCRIKKNADSLFCNEFSEYQETAIKMDRGVWDLPGIPDTLILDPFVSTTEILARRQEIADSLNKNNIPREFNFGKYVASTTLGIVGAAGGFFGGALVFGAISGIGEPGPWTVWGYMMLGSVTGTVVGSSLAMYWHAKSFDPKVSYWGVLGLTSAGFGIAALYVAACEKIKHNNPLSYLGVLIPTAVGSLYANVIAPPLYNNIPAIDQTLYLSNKLEDNYTRQMVKIDLLRIGL